MEEERLNNEQKEDEKPPSTRQINKPEGFASASMFRDHFRSLFGLEARGPEVSQFQIYHEGNPAPQNIKEKNWKNMKELLA